MSSVFLPDGKIKVNVEYQGRTSWEEIYIVTEEYDALLGRIWYVILVPAFKKLILKSY
jgi:hypothetical protein